MRIKESVSGSTDDPVSMEDSPWGLLVAWTKGRCLASAGLVLSAQDEEIGKEREDLRITDISKILIFIH